MLRLVPEVLPTNAKPAGVIPRVRKQNDGPLADGPARGRNAPVAQRMKARGDRPLHELVPPLLGKLVDEQVALLTVYGST